MPLIEFRLPESIARSEHGRQHGVALEGLDRPAIDLEMQRRPMFLAETDKATLPHIVFPWRKPGLLRRCAI